MGKQEAEYEVQQTKIVGAPKVEAPKTNGVSGTIDVDHLFTYHAPHGDQPARYESIREGARIFAKIILNNTKPSADQTTAIRKLREAVQIANASIALER